MATWKKVIVSGSNANLSTLSVDNLTSGQVVIGGGTGNLSTTAINGTGTIVATTGASGLSHSGSFSGSFQGTISGGNAFIQSGNSFGTTAVLGTNDTQNLQLKTSGSVRMTISSSGNVGIGTATPTSASLVVNSSGTGSDTYIAQFQGGGIQRFNFTSDGRMYWGLSAITSSANGYVSWDTDKAILGAAGNTNNLSFVAGTIERMFISSSGNVGIGNTNPNVALDVTGEIAIRGTEGADDARMYFRAADNSNRFTIETDLDTSNTLDKLGFRSTFADNILVLGGNGNVGIGTLNPSASLHIKPPAPTTSGQTGIVVEADAGRGINLISDNYNTNQSVTTFGRLQSSMAAFLAYGINTTGSNTLAYQSSQDAFANRPTALELGNAYFALKYNTSSISRTYGTAVSMSTSLYMDGTTGRIGIGTQTPQGILHISSSGYNEPYPFVVGFNQFVVSASGNVGIGITTPSASLHINNVGTVNSFLVEDSTNIDATPFVIDSVGDVSIGSTASYSPYGTITKSKLDINAGSTGVPLTIRRDDATADHIVFVKNDTNAKWWAALTNDDFRLYNSSGSNNIVFGVNGSTVDTGNKVGIGVGVPTARLSVSGNIDLTSSISTAINIQSGAGVRTYIASDGGGSAFGSKSNHPVYFIQNNIERARIDVGGNFGIGKDSPNARLDVSGSAIISGSLTVTGGITGSITASGVFGPYGANSVISSSYAVNSAATTGTLTFGEGLTTGTFNGSSNVTLTVSGAAQLTDNAITKWNNTDNKFVVSSLTDNGTLVTGASSIQLTGASSRLTGSFTGSFKGDGSGLTGLATTLSVSASLYAGHPTPTSGSVSLGSQGLTIQGTSNEIEAVISGQTVTIGLPNDVAILNQLTVGGDLFVNGTTTFVNTTDLLVEDKFILLASGSTSSGDAGIIIDRGSDANLNIAFGFDSATDRFGFQNGLSDSTNAMTIGTDGNSAFVGTVFTEATHTSTKPTTGEFVVAGAIYTNTDGTIWMYS